MKYLPLFVMLIILAGCAPAATPTPTAIVRVFVSPAAQPWLSEMYPCADENDLILFVSDPGTADVTLRIGEPDTLLGSAFQIDQDEILVVTHQQTGVGTLTLEQVRAIFSGQVSNWQEVGGNDVPIEVWVYADGEDVQQVFEQSVLNGLKVPSKARLAVSAQHMSDSVGQNPGAIGILPRRWKMGNTHETFTAAQVPVLAITRATPDEALETVLSCLQK